ncbi:MAG TPA: DMT family transporter [Aliiroseovarius sp.]|nr:DMT family transporter [Aliiroseovarius sp.]
MSRRIWLTALLVLLGAGWGLTQPLSKIAVSTGHGPLGLIFWQLVIGALVLALVNIGRKAALPVGRRALLWYLFLAIAGTLLPNTTSFISYAYLPSGIMSIVIAMVPLFAFPIALMLGNDRFGWVRLLGVAVGLVGVVILARPGVSIPLGTAGFLALALVAPLLYAVEANVVARWGAGGLDPVTLLLGASILGAVLALPLAVGSGQWIDPRAGMAAPEWALVGSSVIHAFVYSGYVWLVGRAGATFAAQVSYPVTGFGVLWAMLLLGESYSGWVWLALALMFSGLFLVQPHKRG